MTDVKKGDVVILNSGGPKMTVESGPFSGGSYKCYWFDGATAKEQIFDPAALKKAE